MDLGAGGVVLRTQRMFMCDDFAEDLAIKTFRPQLLSFMRIGWQLLTVTKVNTGTKVKTIDMVNCHLLLKTGIKLGNGQKIT